MFLTRITLYGVAAATEPNVVNQLATPLCADGKDLLAVAARDCTRVGKRARRKSNWFS